MGIKYEHANFIIVIFVRNIVPGLQREFDTTSPKKTAVGAEKEIKFWVFYSRLKSIFIDEHIFT